MVLYLKKYRIQVISLIWAYCALFGVVYYLKTGTAQRNYSNNMIYLFLYIAFAFLIAKIIPYVNKRRLIWSVPFSVLTSGMFLIGAQIEYERAISWTLSTCVQIVALTAFFVPAYIWLFYMCTEYEAGSCEWNTEKWKKWKIYAIIVFFWALAYLALFPGIYDYDSIDQTLQFLVRGEISSHHPVIHSAVLSAFLWIGQKTVGSYEIGLELYSLLQLLFLAYAAMSVSWYLLEKKRKILFLLSLVFYAVFPVHYIMAVWATKDTIFSGLFALVSLSLIRMMDEDSEFWKSKRNILKFIILVLMMCMFRNNGIYALVLMVPVCFFCYKKARWKVILLVAISSVLYLSYQNVLLPALGVRSGNFREMMSIPCQQMAKVYTETPEVYMEEEKEALFELIPEENLMDYQIRPMISDATKNFFDSEMFKEDPVKYAKLYVDIGLKSPRKYVEAFLTNSLGFWYPDKSYPDERMFHPYVEFDMADPDLFKGDYIYLERTSLFPQYETVLRMVMQDTVWQFIPIISNFFVPGTYFIVLLFAIGISFYRKDYKRLVVMGFWAGLWFTLLISPVALIRYAYPVVVCLPFLAHFIVSGETGQEDKLIKMK